MISTTATLAAFFIPISFLPGQAGAGELYDLATDPHEMTNFRDTSSAAALRARLAATIAVVRPGMIPAAPRVGWH